MPADLLPPLPLLAAFLTASLVLAVTPGPGVFYIVTRSVTQGRPSGLASVGGMAVGNFICSTGSVLGLSALFAASALAFTIVKWAGALYLIWLGINALRKKPAAEGDPVTLPRASLFRTFRDGVLVGVLHPKTVIFFAAFLPQFMTPGLQGTMEGGLQAFLLGSLFVAIAAVTDTIYALSASAMTGVVRFTPLQTAGRYLTGGAFIGLGLLTAFTGNRAK